jgi:hypothetical protein
LEPAVSAELTAAVGSMAAAIRSESGAASARGAGIAESRLGLSVLANVYKPSHQVLVAERCNGVLCLLPSGIFHNATALYPHPVNLHPSHNQPSDHYL